MEAGKDLRRQVPVRVDERAFGDVPVRRHLGSNRALGDFVPGRPDEEDTLEPSRDGVDHVASRPERRRRRLRRRTPRPSDGRSLDDVVGR